MKMKRYKNTDFLRNIQERIEGNKIIIDGQGHFPKKIVIMMPGEDREYELRKTVKGNYQLL